MFKKKQLSVAVASVVAAGSVAHAAQQPRIEEVVVTATKRQESMQDVPVSVTALQTDQLDELRIGTFGDYMQYLPNLVSQGTGPGQQELYIRGAATTQTILSLSSVQGLKPAVALYLDEQPVSLQGRNLDVYATDLERIEVLPGPQGTLFGASSQAGTVRLITNKPEHTGFGAGFDTSISSTKGGEMSRSVEAYMNLPVTDKLAIRIAAYNDRQGGWIDNKLNGSVPGSWQGSPVVIDRNSGFGNLVDPENTPMVVPDNSNLVADDFNDATYAGGRFSVSYLINQDWDVLVQHTQQSLDTEGVFHFDANLEDNNSVQRFNPDENEDDFGLTTWTINGRLRMLDVIYTGGYLDRDVDSQIDYTGYTNGGLFQAYYTCALSGTDFGINPDNVAPEDERCFDPSKFYQEDTENTRWTHELRISTPQDNRWRVTAGVFYDDTELSSLGLFELASVKDVDNQGNPIPGTGLAEDPFNFAERVHHSNPEGTNSDGGPQGPRVSFINDVTRTTSQIATFGEFEFDILRDLTATFGARWYSIDDEYEGATTTVNVTERLEAFGKGTLEALENAPADAAISDPQATFEAIESGQLDVDGLDDDGVLNVDDVIFRVGLDWHATDNILLFTNFAQGFRPPVTNRVGGDLANRQTGVFRNFRIPIFSETDDLDNYEVGFKSDLLNGTLRLNVTGFFSEISDLQTSRFDSTNISFLWFADNVGDAEILGVDGDFVWAPTNNLTISGAFSILDTELTELDPELEGIAPPEGSKLPYSADFSGNLRARYDFPIPEFGRLPGLRGYVTGAITYKGESFSGLKMDAFLVEDTTRRVFGRGSGLKIKREADVFEGAPEDAELLGEPGAPIPGGRYVQDDYILLDMAVGVTHHQWKAEFFVDNLTDKTAEEFIDTQSFTARVVPNRPRSYGFRLSYDLQR